MPMMDTGLIGMHGRSQCSGTFLMPASDYMYFVLVYILKQWIVLMARADWLGKLRISCAIYLRATREEMASRFGSVTSEEII